MEAPALFRTYLYEYSDESHRPESDKLTIDKILCLQLCDRLSENVEGSIKPLHQPNPRFNNAPDNDKCIQFCDWLSDNLARYIIRLAQQPNSSFNQAPRRVPNNVREADKQKTAELVTVDKESPLPSGLPTKLGNNKKIEEAKTVAPPEIMPKQNRMGRRTYYEIYGYK